MYITLCFAFFFINLPLYPHSVPTYDEHLCLACEQEIGLTNYQVYFCQDKNTHWIKTKEIKTLYASNDVTIPDFYTININSYKK